MFFYKAQIIRIKFNVLGLKVTEQKRTNAILESVQG